MHFCWHHQGSVKISYVWIEFQKLFEYQCTEVIKSILFAMIDQDWSLNDITMQSVW